MIGRNFSRPELWHVFEVVGHLGAATLSACLWCFFCVYDQAYVGAGAWIGLGSQDLIYVDVR